MANLTLNDYLTFFKHLDLREKVNVLAELTTILNDDVMNQKVNSTIIEEETNDGVIDDLFGAWVDEDGLTESTIINRTISDREINLD